MSTWDLIVIGGGPAGLTAGLYGARAGMRTLLLEAKDTGGEIALTERVDDYPGFETISGRELADRMAAQARLFGCEIRTYAPVHRVRRTDDGLWAAELWEGGEQLAHAMIIAVGGEPTKLGVPGESEMHGRGVSYCAICDAPFFRDQDIAVIGGGDSAFQETIYLARFARTIHLIHRRDTFRAQQTLQDRVRALPNVRLVAPATVDAIRGGDHGVEAIDLTGDGVAERLPVQGVFVFIGFTPLGRGLFQEHVPHDSAGHLVTDTKMRLPYDGLYAIGDTRSQVARQVTTAVGDATTAVVHAQRYVEERRATESGAARP